MSANPKTQATRERWALREKLRSGVGFFVCASDCTHGVDLMAYCPDCEVDE